MKLLKSIKSAVERMDLISSNETIDDVPTSSLQYLTVDAYLAVAVENIAAPIENRESLLQESQVISMHCLSCLCLFPEALQRILVRLRCIRVQSATFGDFPEGRR